MSLARANPTGGILPVGIVPSDFVGFIFKGKYYMGIINNIDGNILHITLFPSGQQVKLYYSNGIWLVENRAPVDVSFTKSTQEHTLNIEEKIDFTGSQLSDLNILILLDDQDFNALCRTNKHLGQLCQDPSLQNQIYEGRILVHMPDEMKYVTGNNYKEVYQSIRKVEGTQLYDDLTERVWQPFDDFFEAIPYVDEVTDIIMNDDVTALRYLIDIDGTQMFKMLSYYHENINQLLAENGAVKIITWLIRSGEWKDYHGYSHYGDFVETEADIVRSGVELGTEQYLQALEDLELYTGDPDNPYAQQEQE